MKEKKRDRKLVKDPVGDPAFYNDQVCADNKPVKTIRDKNEEKRRKL